MSELNVNGKRPFMSYPSPSVSFPRLHKPLSPLQTTSMLPPLSHTPPPFRPVSAHPLSHVPSPTSLPPLPSDVPLPRVPELASFMVHNRVAFDVISGDIGSQDLGLATCKSSKELIEAAKKFSGDLSAPDLPKVLDLRDKVFMSGGTYVFSPEQFVRFYSVYNMFLTEERSWDPRLSEKFFNSSRTRLRCSCRGSSRGGNSGKRHRPASPDGGKSNCVCAVYEMSFWPLHKLVIWQCIQSPTHDMEINASLGVCQLVENAVCSLGMFCAPDIEAIIKLQLVGLDGRLFLDRFDVDKIRSLLRHVEENTLASPRSSSLATEFALASHLAEKYLPFKLSYRQLDLGLVKAALIYNRDNFVAMFEQERLCISIEQRFSLLHHDEYTFLNITGESGRHGVTVFIPLKERNSQFPTVMRTVLREIEKIGFELFPNPSFSGFSAVTSVEVSCGSPDTSDAWTRAFEGYEIWLRTPDRFLAGVKNTKTLLNVLKAQSARSLSEAEYQLKLAIEHCDEQRELVTASFLRKQLQMLPLWAGSPAGKPWAVTIKQSQKPPVQATGYRSTLAGAILHLAMWIHVQTPAMTTPSTPSRLSRIGISSVLITPPASEDDI